MNTPIEIQTEQSQVSLRQLTVGDAPAYYEAVEANRDHLSQFGDETAVKYPDLKSVVDSIENPSNPHKIRMGIWDNDTFVGSINLTPKSDEEAEVGYWLDERRTGNGYATTATRAVSNYAGSRYSRVYAEVVEGNIKSTGVLERSGFHAVAHHAGKIIFEQEGKSTESISRASEEDLSDIVTFLETAYADTYPNDRGITREMFEGNQAFRRELRAYFGEQLANPQTLLLFMKKDGKVIGTVGVRFTERDPSAVELWGFYVDADLHGSGVASQLYDKVMESDQVVSAEKIQLSVAKDSKRAKSFYEKHGFIVIDEEDWDWPHWAEEHPHNQYWVMQKKLH